MTKLYVLFKRTYGDFDIAHDEPVAVSQDMTPLLEEMKTLASRLTPAQKEAEVSYWVDPKTRVRVI